jgi:hypothetical protein
MKNMRIANQREVMHVMAVQTNVCITTKSSFEKYIRIAVCLWAALIFVILTTSFVMNNAK